MVAPYSPAIYTQNNSPGLIKDILYFLLFYNLEFPRLKNNSNFVLIFLYPILPSESTNANELFYKSKPANIGLLENVYYSYIFAVYP